MSELEDNKSMNKIVTILATILIGVLSCGVIYLIYLSALA
jgi:hypothetical protein